MTIYANRFDNLDEIDKFLERHIIKKKEKDTLSKMIKKQQKIWIDL